MGLVKNSPKKTFGIRVNRCRIIWSPIKISVKTTIKIIISCYKLHNFIAEKGKEEILQCTPSPADNEVNSKRVIHSQNHLQTEKKIGRERRTNLQKESIRYGNRPNFHILGFNQRTARRFLSVSARVSGADFVKQFMLFGFGGIAYPFCHFQRLWSAPQFFPIIINSLCLQSF